MRISTEKGVALVFSLFVMVVLLGFTGVFLLRTINATNAATRERSMAKSFYIADASSDAALEGLDNLINNLMFNTVNGMNPSTLIALAQANVNDGINFLFETVENAGAPALTVTVPGTEATYAINSTSLGSGNYQYTIYITEKTNPIVYHSGDEWDFPYNFRIEAAGSSDNSSREVILNGDFTVNVQRDNFAKYALFTNNQTTPSGTNVWFTSKTNFAGPLHTNGRYNIYGNPSGTFDDVVSQVEQEARFYNNGFSVLIDDDHNSTIDVPTFNEAYTRGADPITLGSATQEQDLIDQALAGSTASSNGIYVPNSGGALTGGIYVKGDSTVSMAVDGSDNAVYTITQGSATKTITVNQNTNQTTVNDGTSAITYNGKPDGVDNVGTIIYVAGNVTGLSGTVQSDTQLTLSSDQDIVITNNLVYSDYSAGSGTPGQAGYVPPSAEGYTNLLGLVSWNGKVRIGTAAPNDVNIHATVLSQDGIFTVDNYNDTGVGPRGTATLLGGVITDDYGAFGQFNGSTGAQISGYGRNFVYDERMKAGSAPPYFPSLNTFIAFSNDITDKIIWQEGDSDG